MYYEQYLTVQSDTITSLSICIAAVFLVSVLFMGIDILAGLYVIMGVAGVILSMFGLMYFWNIWLNAVSLVNLVMVSYEFEQKNDWCKIKIILFNLGSHC